MSSSRSLRNQHTLTVTQSDGVPWKTQPQKLASDRLCLGRLANRQKQAAKRATINNSISRSDVETLSWVSLGDTVKAAATRITKNTASHCNWFNIHIPMFLFLFLVHVMRGFGTWKQTIFRPRFSSGRVSERDSCLGQLVAIAPWGPCRALSVFIYTLYTLRLFATHRIHRYT